MKTFNIPTEIDENKILKTYSNIIENIKDVNHHYIAISYHNLTLWQKINDIVKKSKIKTIIILKIEKEINLEEIELVCQQNLFDMLLIDRGEIGVNMPYYKIGLYQNNLLDIAKKYNKPTIISTQILESTMNNYIPNRAEILDLTNEVLSGVNGVMFCRETAINPRAAYTLSVARKIIEEVEKYKN